MKSIRLVAVLAFALLSACATQGPLETIQETFPRGEVITLGVHNQSVPDYLLDQQKLQLNFLIKGKGVSAEQLAAIAKAEKLCRFYTGKVRPSNLVAVVSSGIIYAIAGGVGLGLGSQAFQGAVASQYARYGAEAGGFSGAANGVITLAGQTYTFENCGREVMEALPGYQIRVLNRSPY
jgi:hypothetical protein